MPVDLTRFQRNHFFEAIRWAPTPKLGAGWIAHKSDAPSAPAAPDPAKQVAAESAANRVNVKSPFGSVTYTQNPSTAPQALSFDDWYKQSFPNGVPGGQPHSLAEGEVPVEGGGGMGAPVNPTALYLDYTKNFAAQNPSDATYTQNVNLSPEEQALYQGRNAISAALLGHGGANISTMAPNFEFNGATDPTTNKFFMAQKALLDPVFARETDSLEQRLANQGLPTGSDGNESAADYERNQLTKAHDAAYEQASANALDNGFNQDLAARQQNYNEIAAALNGSQLNVPGAQTQPLDVTSAFANQQAGLNRQYQGQMANYQADVGQTNTGVAAAATMAAAFI